MKTLAASLFLVVSAFAQDAKPYLGRWDITVTPAQGAPYAGWMELTQMAGKLEGRYQPRGGEWKPFSAATLENGTLVATLAPAGNGPATTWNFTASGSSLSGVQKRGDTEGPKLAAVRAPELNRPMPKAWTTPEPLLNGKDLTGWEPIGNVQNSKWVARDGELVNDNPEVPGQRNPGAANIKTTRKFQDYKLHIEV